MNHFSFFDHGHHLGDASMTAQHHGGLVLLSLLVAFICSCAAFHMAASNRKASSAASRHLSLICASLVMGLGIWAMHFIGMMAVELPGKTSYGIGLTLLSILPSIVAAWLALWRMGVRAPSNARIIISGSLVGLGIGAMHYCGIAALQVDGILRWQPWGFVLSLAAGLVFAIAAFGLQRRWYRRGMHNIAWLWRLVPALVLTVAMASMHYLSMLALRFTPTPPVVRSGWNIANSQELALLIALVTMGVLLLLGSANAMLRYRDLWQGVAIRDARLQAMVQVAKDGVITIDQYGVVLDFNPSAAKIFGYSREEVVGNNVSMLMPSPLAEQHDSHVHRNVAASLPPAGQQGREVLGKCKDGRLVPLDLSIGKAQTDYGIYFIGYVKDISQRKRTDTQLRIAASVFEHVREGVAIVDANRNISDINPAFLRLLQVSRESCIGRSLETLLEDSHPEPDLHKMWQQVASVHYAQSETTYMRSDGQSVLLRFSISPVLNELQRPHHYIAVLSDISSKEGLAQASPKQQHSIGPAPTA